MCLFLGRPWTYFHSIVGHRQSSQGTAQITPAHAGLPEFLERDADKIATRPDQSATSNAAISFKHQFECGVHVSLRQKLDCCALIRHVDHAATQTGAVAEHVADLVHLDALTLSTLDHSMLPATNSFLQCAPRPQQPPLSRDLPCQVRSLLGETASFLNHVVSATLKHLNQDGLVFNAELLGCNVARDTLSSHRRNARSWAIPRRACRRVKLHPTSPVLRKRYPSRSARCLQAGPDTGAVSY
ncbi:hypothetical protein ABIA06_006326 [Bradyrhizobium yuanmingense]